MVVLRGIGHAKVKTHLVQKVGFGQGNGARAEIGRNLEHQAVSADLKTGVVDQHALCRTPILVQLKALQQRRVIRDDAVQGHPHAGRRCAVHGVQYMCAQAHGASPGIARIAIIMPSWPRPDSMTLYDSTLPYPRDLIGYGRHPVHAQWQGQARIALQFVLNYEEGAENSVLHGDPASEQFLSEMASPAAFAARHLSMESIYEYGSRAGVWRILREFEQRQLPLTVFAVSMGLQRHPELCAALKELGHEIACHGWRWISYQNLDEATEREHMRLGMEILTRLTGERPLGWYTGRDSPNTHRLVADYGGFDYDSDYYGDDLPFWMRVQKSDGAVVPQLIVPYTLDTNDMRFASSQGFAQGEDFFTYLKDSFDVLYAEGDPAGLDTPKMLSVGMHCRLLGRPGRMRALQEFLDYVQSHPRVWICRRIDIARHWKQAHPYLPPALSGSGICHPGPDPGSSATPPLDCGSGPQ